MPKLLQVTEKMSRLLSENENCDVSFEINQLLVFVTEKTRLEIGMQGEISFAQEQTLYELCEKRKNGYPLQYILGTWQFFDLDLAVGEGVLIPRQDTETVCEAAFKYIEKMPFPNVLDLCSGSGAIALAVKKYCPNSVVTAVEKSAEAYGYLLKNIESTKLAVLPIMADVFRIDYTIEEETFDCIISNPPYINNSLKGALQKEVTFEPEMALFADDDGLRFYKFISKYYKPALKEKGYLIFEYGFDQAKAVKNILLELNYNIIEEITDLGGNPRGIIAQKP